jgi:amino acid permease
MILPYDDPNLLTQGAKSVSISPFTLVFKKGGLDALAHVINGVILCTILSCANSGLYVSSRTLHALALEGLTHKRLGKDNDQSTKRCCMLMSNKHLQPTSTAEVYQSMHSLHQRPSVSLVFLPLSSLGTLCFYVYPRSLV